MTVAGLGQQTWQLLGGFRQAAGGVLDPQVAGLTRAAWIGGWTAAARWHRYETQGIEHLLTGQPCLIVGYHGRPLAWDMCMLSVEVHRQLGYLPHGVVHSGLGAGPMATVLRGLGFVTGDGPELEAAVQRGEHILVTPGGTREGCRSQSQRYKVDWGNRLGYLKLAWRHRLPIVPVAATGVDDVFWGLNDGDRWGRRLGLPLKLPFWIGLGPAGVWPLSPSFPVQIRQQIGAPLVPWEDRSVALGPDALPAATVLQQCHLRIQAQVQSMLDTLRKT